MQADTKKTAATSRLMIRWDALILLTSHLPPNINNSNPLTVPAPIPTVYTLKCKESDFSKLVLKR
jgi:hypothetical protein